MRGLLVYWIIGCLALGVGHAAFHKRCPNDEWKPAESITFVAVWPMVIPTLFMLTTDDIKLKPCKVAAL